jgi:hypothetical protein
MRRFIEWLVARVIARAQRTPYFHLEGYMERWWFFGGSARDRREDHELGWERTWLDRLIGRFVAVRIHRIISSDDVRALHDHPWWFVTVIMRGGYLEVLPEDQGQPASCDRYYNRKIWRRPGSVVFHRGTDRHRLEIRPGSECWTFFIMGPVWRDWGFHTHHGWVYWRDYLKSWARPADF